MRTECTTESFRFQRIGKREVASAFDGGVLTSDGGGLLLREIEARCRVIQQFSSCFTDHRRLRLHG